MLRNNFVLNYLELFANKYNLIELMKHNCRFKLNYLNVHKFLLSWYAYLDIIYIDTTNRIMYVSCSRKIKLIFIVLF